MAPGFARTAIATVLLSALSAPAWAVPSSTSTFDFTFSGIDNITGDSVTASFDVQATPNGDGSYTAISGTAVVGGAGAAQPGTYSLIPNPQAPNVNTTYESDHFDDQLYPANPGGGWITTGDGLLFGQDGNNWLLNVNNNADTPGTPPYELTIYDNATSNMDTDAAGTLSAVPEPICLSVFGVGLFGLGLARFRRGA